MINELPALLLRVNLALAAAILLVLVLRRPVRALFGARAAYGLWIIAPLAAIAVLLPARTVQVPAPLRPTVESASDRPVVASAVPAPMVAVDTVKQGLRPYRPRDALIVLWALVALLALGVQAERQRRFLKSLGRLREDKGLFHAEHPGVGPAVIGALSPRLVLPADFTLRFTPEEQTLILAHERNHLSTGDAQINALTTAIQCLFWFNPLVHLGANRLRVDQEIACDAAVLTRFPVARRAYGEAMLKTQLAPHAPPLGCHWPASANTHLKERFVMLKDHRQGARRRLAGAASVAVLALGSGFAAWAAQPARPVQDRPGVSAHDRARDIASPLYRAVTERDLARAQALIAAGAKVDFVAKGDGTPLIEAARSGQADMVRLLLDKGADPNLAVRGDGTPLISAVRSGDMAVIRLLIEKGADVNRIVPRDGNPLIVAASAGHLDIVSLLVEHGASVEAFVPGDETPLINAARSGHLSTVAYLIDKGADVNRAVPSNPGQTRSPLGEAVKRGHTAVAEYLKTKGARA
jgi:beta-lactamase regulating signal transducer with metallopeptidase domain